jgi:hypothetical protein
LMPPAAARAGTSQRDVPTPQNNSCAGYFFFLVERRALERFGVDFFRVDFLDFLAIGLLFFRGLTRLRHG